MDLAIDGAQLHPKAALPALPLLIDAIADIDRDRAGVRIDGATARTLRPILTRNGPIGRLAAGALGQNARPVRVLLFDKSPAANWGLGWHQDRVICVRERRETPGFHAWTVKAGQFHVSPPFAILERMVTLRVHLDPVDGDNAPLRIAPGSHRLGRIGEAEILAAVARCGERTCLAEAGDVWLYATLILHASAPAARPRARRVLQIDYTAQDLPGGLEWAGV